MRASGKTFRAVLRALELASQGKEVFLSSSHGRKESIRVFDMALGMCRSALSPDFVSVDRNHLTIRFKDSGHIHFFAEAHRDLRGKADLMVIQD